MQLKRLFSTTSVKNTYGYIDTQKRYEIIRTILYYGISASLYIAGYITTKSNKNALTIVAMLGCLPATKSLIGMIMFLRYKSCAEDVYKQISDVTKDFSYQLYDLVFTTEKINYVCSHGAFINNKFVFYTDQTIDKDAFTSHLKTYLKRAELKSVDIHIYTDLKTYLNVISNAEECTDASKYIQLLKEITL